MEYEDQIAQMLVDLKVREMAHEDAKDGIPSQDSKELGNSEEQLVHSTVKFVKEKLKGIEARLTECEDRIHDVEEALSKSASLRKNSAIGAVSKAALEASEFALKKATASYNKFKLDRGVDREANYPDEFARLSYAVLIAIIEGLFNSYFFSKGSDLGLLGGMLQAFFVSIVNVSFAFIAGALFLRYMNHSQPSKKFAGFVGFFMCVSVCLAVVMGSSIYRGALERLSENFEGLEELLDDAWQITRQSFVEGDLSGIFASFDSSIFFFVGLLCMIIALWEGYKIDDPIPGFSKLRMDMDDAAEEHKEKEREYNAEVASLKRSKAGEIDLQIRSLNDIRKELAKFNAIGVAIMDERPSVFAAKIAKALLSKYREENAKIRADEPPAYFRSFEPKIGLFDQDQFEAQRSRIADMQARVDEAQQNISEELQKLRTMKNEFSNVMGA